MLVDWVFDIKPNTSFMDVDPAMDLIKSNEAVNVLNTALNANVLYQSYGIIVAKGFDEQEQEKVKVGANRTTFIGEDQDISIEAPPDTMESINATVKTRIHGVSLNYHLPHGFIEEEGVAESGVARKIRNEELQTDRKGDIVRWRNTEERLYEIEKAIVKVDLQIDLPDTISIDYTESEEILTNDERRAQEEYDMKHGFRSAAEILHESDKDRYPTIEKAQDQIDINRGANTTETDTDKLLSKLASPLDQV